MTLLVTTSDTRETEALGRRLASLLQAGDLVVLTGPLGAGKTALTRGIGAGLGVQGAVTSPTFVLAREHRPDPERGGRLPLVHVDAYRLRRPDGSLPGLDALEDLDLPGALEDAVVVVEWGEGLGEVLGHDHLEVRLERQEQAAPLPPTARSSVDEPDEPGTDEPRTLHLRPSGPRWRGVDLGALLAP